MLHKWSWLWRLLLNAPTRVRLAENLVSAIKIRLSRDKAGSFVIYLPFKGYRLLLSSSNTDLNWALV